jgi:2-polyprenyl-3-methyl-5-hydroxy-6-metoxy-1,4-benzoquinol methylase
MIEVWISALGRRDLTIFDVGCGSGWLCERLLAYGQVTGIDLAGEVIERARLRVPDATFIAGDFMGLALPSGKADVIVTLEVLSHVADQPAFLAKLARMLKPGGLLMIATQNRFVLERSADVAPRAPGQIRRWVNQRELRRLLEPKFEIVELTSVFPNWGHSGILRIVNSPKLSAIAGRLVPLARIDRLKERYFFGHTLMALARRKP